VKKNQIDYTLHDRLDLKVVSGFITILETIRKSYDNTSNKDILCTYIGKYVTTEYDLVNYIKSLKLGEGE
jgi:hypothetical protein